MNIIFSISSDYEAKISSLEDSKDLSKITLREMVKTLCATNQRKLTREEENSVGAFLAKSTFSKGKGRALCNLCKRYGHIKNGCCHK